ncbi:MAG TPA: 1-phosphofructokinase family hexose kinase [Rhizomicrobium sp.]|nr:1-phosphofructokinase family hexose kinase [Rhizomicrobium sp.]
MPVVLTLTINPAVDLSTSVEAVEPFHKLRCAPVRRDPGGGGINVARVLKRFGVDATAIFPRGGPTGDQLARCVRSEDIRSIEIPILGDTREDFTAFETRSGRQFRFVTPGPELLESEWRACLDAVDTKADFIVASGSLPPGVPDDFYARAASIAKKHGAKFILDTSGPALAAALKEGVFLVKPNLRELSELLHIPLESERARVNAARELVASGAAQMIALSMAEEGALLIARDEAWRAATPDIAPVSTVGAGDSFLGAMVWRLILGAGGADALAHAVAAGTAALLSPGTELCHADNVRALLAQVKAEKI